MVPGGGDLFGLITSPLAQRRDEWFADLERRLRDLEKRVEGFRVEALQEDEAFISATLQATQAAQRTHQAEKREALRNAVLNVALAKEINADRQGLFLALVDRFTAAHLVILRFFHDPAGYFARIGAQTPEVPIGTKLLANQFVMSNLGELASQLGSPVEDRYGTRSQTIDLILNDLIAAQLIVLDRLGDGAWAIPSLAFKSASAPVAPITTHLGTDFLAFISEPS